MNKKVAPKSPVFTNCLKAFLIGGGICTLAEVIVQLLQTYAGMEQKEARLVGSIALIFLIRRYFFVPSFGQKLPGGQLAPDVAHLYTAEEEPAGAAPAGEQQD